VRISSSGETAVPASRPPPNACRPPGVLLADGHTDTLTNRSSPCATGRAPRGAHATSISGACMKRFGPRPTSSGGITAATTTGRLSTPAMAPARPRRTQRERGRDASLRRMRAMRPENVDGVPPAPQTSGASRWN
jgi:hypothetical protein